MSEKSPEKQRKYQPLTDNCNNCEQDYPITSANAQVFHHSEQPELDHILCTCLHCEQPWRIFIGEDTLADAVHLKLPFTVDKYGSNELHLKWLVAQGYELPEVYELTPRHEELVQKFAHTVANMPTDLLYDELTTDHSKPHTERWI